MGRTPVYKQTDFALRHAYRFGSDNKYMIVQRRHLNLFNSATVTTGQIHQYAGFSVTTPSFGLITRRSRAAMRRTTSSRV